MSFQGSSHVFSDSSGRLSSKTGYYGSKVLTLAGYKASCVSGVSGHFAQRAEEYRVPDIFVCRWE